MNRLIGLFAALGFGLWAQRMLTGPQPGLSRDALIVFILAGILFVWNAQAPKPVRESGQPVGRPWPRLGLVLSLAGLAAGLVSLVLLWQNLQSVPGLVLWPLGTLLFVLGTMLEGNLGAKPVDPELEQPSPGSADPLGAAMSLDS